MLSPHMQELSGLLANHRLKKKQAIDAWRANSPLRATANYPRSTATRAQWDRLQRDLAIVRTRFRIIRTLDEFRGKFPELGARLWRGSRALPYAMDVAIPISERELELVDASTKVTTFLRLQHQHTRPLRVYFNPLHEADPEHEAKYLVRFEGSNYLGPSFYSLQAGAAVYCSGRRSEARWFLSAADMEEQVQAKAVKALVYGEVIQNYMVESAELAQCTVKKDLSGQPVYVFGDNHRRDYHSGTNYREERYVNMDPSAKRTVGVELEFNSGRTTAVERSEVIQDWLIAMDGKALIERDGSVTAFEIVTGHGKPSSLRQLLAPVFRDPRMKRLAIGGSTGAHVHVSASHDEKLLLTGSPGNHLHGMLCGVYRSLANRRHNRYAYAVRQPDYDRYCEASISSDLPTLELRLFKSDRNLPRIIRNAQFANAYMEFLAHWGVNIHDKALEDFWSLVADLPREETVELRTWATGHGHKVPNRRGELRNLYRELGFSRSLVN